MADANNANQTCTTPFSPSNVDNGSRFVASRSPCDLCPETENLKGNLKLSSPKSYTLFLNKNSL